MQCCKIVVDLLMLADKSTFSFAFYCSPVFHDKARFAWEGEGWYFTGKCWWIWLGVVGGGYILWGLGGV